MQVINATERLGRPGAFGTFRSKEARLTTRNTASQQEPSAKREKSQARQRQKGAEPPEKKLSATKAADKWPRGLLVVGFPGEDASRLQEWFAELEPEFKVSICNAEMLGKSLQDAVTCADGSFRCNTQWQEPQELLPRVALFSGMSEEETLGIAQHWEATGLRPPIFVSAVDAARQMVLRELLVDITRSHAANRQVAGPESDKNSLRELLRKKMAAKGLRIEKTNAKAADCNH